MEIFSVVLGVCVTHLLPYFKEEYTEAQNW